MGDTDFISASEATSRSAGVPNLESGADAPQEDVILPTSQRDKTSTKESQETSERASAPRTTLDANETKSKKSMRPVRDVLDRIQWDGSFCDSNDIVIGYEDRHEGIKEIAFSSWTKDTTEDEFIPQHRIRYIKRKSDGLMLWNRHLRIDRVFHSG